jgi:hypothetical protein
MRSLWHLLRLHDVQAGYYMGIKTKTRRCLTCRTEWQA